MRKVFFGGVFVSIATAITALLLTAGGGSCTSTVGPSTFASALAGASSGNVLCLTTGDYGTFTGTDKPVVIKAAANSSPSMNFDFREGDSGFVLDGMTNMYGLVSNATDIVIRNSNFSASVTVTGAATRGIVFDHTKFNWPVGPTTSGINAKIVVDNTGSTATLADPAFTLIHSQVKNGDLDGVHISASGVVLAYNTFSNICDAALPDLETNHTDNIQWEAGSETRVVGNYVYAAADCITQGITSFDSGTVGLIIEDNVVDIRRPWGIELFSDQNSIIRHNTMMIYPDSECDFTGISCGKIALDHKPADPVGFGTQVYNNVVSTVDLRDGSPSGTEHHNLCSVGSCPGTGSINNQAPIFKFSNPRFYDGYRLAPNSPGKGTASDGKDMGVTN